MKQNRIHYEKKTTKNQTPTQCSSARQNKQLQKYWMGNKWQGGSCKRKKSKAYNEFSGDNKLSMPAH